MLPINSKAAFFSFFENKIFIISTQYEGIIVHYSDS